MSYAVNVKHLLICFSYYNIRNKQQQSKGSESWKHFPYQTIQKVQLEKYTTH